MNVNNISKGIYRSTRGETYVTSSKAILDGIANDGGLYVTKINKIYDKDSLKKLSKLTYKELAIEILSKFLDDFTTDKVTNIVNKSYDNTFDTNEIVKIKKCDKDLYFLELYHGKTLAFKDVALQVLPNLINESYKINNNNVKTYILTATSGDTGSAALAGFEGIDNVEMIVLYPNNKVSEIQEKQMLSFKNEHRHVYAVNGNFDDCQRIVKNVFSDERIKDYNLSSANSINIGRLIPQIVYYFYTYFKVAEGNEKINFVVPTGNFGNILAGYIAKEMGLPVNKLICAANENNVLDDFFKTSEYNIERDFIKTISPSMDILISSNLERLLFYKLNNPSKVNELMNSLKNNKKYYISLSLTEFASESSKEEETLAGIKSVYDRYKYVIDPHTACGYVAYRKYLNEYEDKFKTVILSTAHPMKFAKSVCEVFDKKFNSEIEAIEYLEKECGVKLPNQIKNLNKAYDKEIWEKDDAYENIIKLIKGNNYD